MVSGNPLYGLNALGGALNIGMKDGFGYQGVESDTRAGSWGRFQEAIQAGKQVDNFAAYVAVEGIHDGGWREFSPSDVKRAYMDLGAKDKDTEFHINFTGARNPAWRGRANAGRAARTELRRGFHQSADDGKPARDALGERQREAFRYAGPLSGVAYLRSFHQNRVDGNVSSVAPCNVLNGVRPERYDTTSPLCLQTASGTIVPVTDQSGKQVLTGIYGPNDTIGEIDYTTNNTNSYGTALQATDKDKLFGLNNIFIAGASVDHGDVKSTSIAELGTLNTQNLTSRAMESF